MKLPVLNYAPSAYVDFRAIQQILDYLGTPYDVVDVSISAFSELHRARTLLVDEAIRTRH